MPMTREEFRRQLVDHSAFGDAFARSYFDASGYTVGPAGGVTLRPWWLVAEWVWKSRASGFLAARGVSLGPATAEHLKGERR